MSTCSSPSSSNPKPLVIQSPINPNTAPQQNPANHRIRREHPLGRIPSILRRPQHADDENDEERDEDSRANPPCSDGADDIEDLASEPAETPSSAIVEDGEGTAEVLREHTQSVGFEPEYESDAVDDEDGDGGETDEYADEVE